MEKPIVLVKRLASGTTLVRFNTLHDLYWYDELENNPTGIGLTGGWGDEPKLNAAYKKARGILSQHKIDLINKARKELSVDKEFLKIVYKAKSERRGYEMSKFGGILSMPRYSRGEDKMFKKAKVGDKKITLNMSFQVGTMLGGDYQESFIAIIKTILMAQAMKISLNIDMFDSDTRAIRGGGYVICNVAKSTEKLNLKNILACSHQEFFNYSLFNGYTASGNHARIGTFLSQGQIVGDLSENYDIIGGNMLNEGAQYDQTGSPMMSKILKIAWKR